MKRIIQPLLIFVAVLMLSVLLAGCAPGLNLNSDGLIVGQSYTLASGQTLNNDLTVIGGDAVLEKDSTVNGDVAVIGGTVTIDGKVKGNVSILGGTTNLTNTAHVTGDVTTLGGSMHKSEGAVVDGQQTDNRHIPPVTTMRTPPLNISFDPITGPLMAIFQGLAVAALAVLISLFAPIPMERTGRAAISQPFAAGGVGCLSIVIIVIMAITIILLPVSALAFVLAVIAGLFGWAALGLMVGRQIAVWLHQPWTDPINAGVGTLAISLLSSMLNLIWCVGFPFYTLVGLVALGAVVLTRFGTQPYQGAAGAAPYNPPPSAYPAATPSYRYTEGSTARIYDNPEPPSDNPPVDPREQQ